MYFCFFKNYLNIIPKKSPKIKLFNHKIGQSGIAQKKEVPSGDI